MDYLLDEIEVSKRLGCTRRCLQEWRRLGKGPAVTRIGRLCKYRESAIEEFIVANTTGGPLAVANDDSRARR